MYKKQLKRVKCARRAVRRQQGLLAEMALEGMVGVSFHTLTRSVTIGMPTSFSAQAVDACREALRERFQQLRAEAQGLRRDWRESREIEAKDVALAQGKGPLPYPGVGSDTSSAL